MNTKKKKVIITFIVVLLLLSVGIGLFLYLKKEESKNETSIEILDSINEYGYSLEDRDTDLYKETFLKLKEELSQAEINYENYATYLGQLFLIDFYTINNKVSKYDVGSLDFIYPDDKEKFQNKAMDTIYKLVEDNSTNSRKQNLPEVTSVNVENVENVSYQKGNNTLEAYKFAMTISYKEDLGYDKSVQLTIAKEEDRLYVVNLSV